MEETKTNTDIMINMITNTLSYLSISTKSDIKYRPMPDPLSVYVPLDALTEETIDSIIWTIQQSNKKDWNHSKRTLLAFLLAINNRITEIENNEKFKEQTILQHVQQIRQWLVEKDRLTNNIQNLNWNELHAKYNELADEKLDGTAKYFGIENFEPYYELTIEGLHPDIERSREYMTRFRNQGWEPHELKLYWNVQQLENLCPPKEDKKTNNENLSLPSHDPADEDVVLALHQYPVSNRNHNCEITYVNKGIEKAVFDAPEDVQLIVLNFANERTPGGGYLKHAWAQEEIILFNSDGYRSLLDLKYGRMGGGYAIPEFGLAYVRDIRFFDKETGKIRKADMLVSACYCMEGAPQLYDNPTSTDEWITKNVAKFRAFIAAAIANTKGDGSNTYLLLGPIGTGAFNNDVTQIGYVFREVLSSKMMGSNGPIRNAFTNIWFVSTDQWKNERFEQILREDNMPMVD